MPRFSNNDTNYLLVSYYWALPICLMLTISFLSFNPAPQLSGAELKFNDKFAHLSVFGLLATGFYRAAALNLRPTVATYVAICATSIFGLLDEICQGMNPCRHMEFYDWLLNLLKF